MRVRQAAEAGCDGVIASAADHPDASPLLTADLSGVAPAHLVLPECDPLHEKLSEVESFSLPDCEPLTVSRRPRPS